MAVTFTVDGQEYQMNASRLTQNSGWFKALLTGNESLTPNQLSESIQLAWDTAKTTTDPSIDLLFTEMEDPDSGQVSRRVRSYFQLPMGMYLIVSTLPGVGSALKGNFFPYAAFVPEARVDDKAYAMLGRLHVVHELITADRIELTTWFNAWITGLLLHSDVYYFACDDLFGVLSVYNKMHGLGRIVERFDVC